VSASRDGQQLDVGVGRQPAQGTLMSASSVGLRQPGCDFVDGYHLRHERPSNRVYIRIHRNATGQSVRDHICTVQTSRATDTKMCPTIDCTCGSAIRLLAFLYDQSYT